MVASLTRTVNLRMQEIFTNSTFLNFLDEITNSRSAYKQKELTNNFYLKLIGHLPNEDLLDLVNKTNLMFDSKIEKVKNIGKESIEKKSSKKDVEKHSKSAKARNTQNSIELKTFSNSRENLEETTNFDAKSQKSDIRYSYPGFSYKGRRSNTCEICGENISAHSPRFQWKHETDGKIKWSFYCAKEKCFPKNEKIFSEMLNNKIYRKYCDYLNKKMSKSNIENCEHDPSQDFEIIE